MDSRTVCSSPSDAYLDIIIEDVIEDYFISFIIIVR